MNQTEVEIPKPSASLVRGFAKYLDWYLPKHFHSVRLARAPVPLGLERYPLLIYMNHSAWWDPLIAAFLATQLFPERTHYAPIEAEALKKYRFFDRIGFFGVEPGISGSARFLRTASRLLSEPGNALWLTPQGRFTDPRVRPVELKGGIGHIAAQVDSVAMVPLAVEYPFWEESRPEALARFGDPLMSCTAGFKPREWTAELARRLEASQDALARYAITRNASEFGVLIKGSAGVGGIYDVWRRAKAAMKGRRFQARHGDEGF
jgi:1-acyl-sn-glycerol-3-phosphate acyltransferase